MYKLNQSYVIKLTCSDIGISVFHSIVWIIGGFWGWRVHRFQCLPVTRQRQRRKVENKREKNKWLVVLAGGIRYQNWHTWYSSEKRRSSFECISATWIAKSFTDIGCLDMDSCLGMAGNGKNVWNYWSCLVSNSVHDASFNSCTTFLAPHPATHTEPLGAIAILQRWSNLMVHMAWPMWSEIQEMERKLLSLTCVQKLIPLAIIIFIANMYIAWKFLISVCRRYIKKLNTCFQQLT